MSRRSRFAVAILVGSLVLAVAVPAQATQRLRVYRGQTSDGHDIAFRVSRTDAGRFLQEIRFAVTFTCEDATTWVSEITYGFARRQVPTVDGTFAFDDADAFLAVHVAGRLGWLTGDGTLSLATAALNDDEQAQMCTTGALTWQVEYVRTITIGARAPEGSTVRIG